VELKEILGQVPGLTKRFVYYLESQGYIRPLKVPKSRIARRDYQDSDLRLIQDVWRYYQRGYTVQRAYELATQSDRAIAYVAFAAPARRWREVIGLLHGFREVVEATPVYGDSWDILVKTDTPDASDIYHSLAPALAEAGITGMPVVWRARQYYTRGEKNGMATSPSSNTLLAYVLMKVPRKDIETVVEDLKSMPEIQEVSVIYGESDIIAKVHVGNVAELDRLVMDKVHGLEPIESTRTFIAISGLHWSR
jgi:DNA-binding Lrp family transcriptional regulator